MQSGNCKRVIVKMRLVVVVVVVVFIFITLLYTKLLLLPAVKQTEALQLSRPFPAYGTAFRQISCG